MEEFYSFTKLLLVFILVGTSLFLNISLTGPQASINGILAGIAFIEAMIIFEYEIKDMR